METSPHQEPAALIQGLGLKSVSLIRVIIAQLLWEICDPPLLQHPGTEVTSSSLSGYCTR